MNDDHCVVERVCLALSIFLEQNLAVNHLEFSKMISTMLDLAKTG